MTPTVLAASKSVDLDGDGVAGDMVYLNVLQTWPPKIQNRVLNNGTNDQTFNWLNAGPGGFKSRVGHGGESRWTWQTSETVYSYTGSVCRNDMCTFTRGGTLQSGAFSVPGRTLTSGSITTSTASLTASLVQSFSPGVTLLECTSSIYQLANGNFAYRTDCRNLADADLSFEIAPQPLDCCGDSNQLRCEAYDGWSGTQNEVPTGDGSGLESVCVDYLSDESNCGDCGVACGYEEFCSTGTCNAVCGDPTYPDYCSETAHDQGALCTDFASDNDNCGGCGIQCGDGDQCVEGACQALCDADLAWCGGTPHDPATADCRDLLADHDNCGACGVACGDQAVCESGTCSSCPNNLKWVCDNVCTNIKNDPNNCGGCGIRCDDQCPNSPSGSNSCNNGRSCTCGSGK